MLPAMAKGQDCIDWEEYEGLDWDVFNSLREPMTSNCRLSLLSLPSFVLFNRGKFQNLHARGLVTT